MTLTDNIKCPECGFEADSVLTIPWGDGQQKTQVVPYVCSGCGAFAMINTVTNTIEFAPDRLLDFLKIINPILHAKVVELQQKVRKGKATDGADYRVH